MSQRGIIIEGKGYCLETMICCRRCRCTNPKWLGAACRPGKTIGLLCKRCWKRARGLRDGHNYNWFPLTQDIINTLTGVEDGPPTL